MLKNNILEEDLHYIYSELSRTDLDKFSNRYILITGSAGFIGYYMLNFLCRYGKELNVRGITALDSLKMEQVGWIKDLQQEYGFLKYYSFDISKDDINKIPEIELCDSIVHMASIASPTFYRQHPLKTIDANVWGLRKLLDYFSQRDIKGFLNFSSSEVYGDPDQSRVPMNEEYFGNVAINGPRACYDEAKRFGETLCYVFNKEFNMKIVSVRPFNNYGPGMRLNDARAPADFANSVVSSKPIVIYSDGSSTRTFTYISDAIVGYLKALYYGKFDYFNIGMDHPEITIQKLAQIFAISGEKVFGIKTEILFAENKDKEYTTNNPKRRSPDISKARRLLNFNPKITIDEGVERYMKFLKEGE